MAAEKPASDARTQRLARALKANLARRKAQARSREQAETPAELPPDEEGCPN